jgi:hypothetical protein
MALQIALGLKPWESSPLPYEITALGVSQDDTPDNNGSTWEPSMPKAIALQRELLAIAGWPDCQQICEGELRNAEEHAVYCREQIEHPPLGECGTGTSPAERQEALDDALAEIKHRHELLAGLDAVQRRWAPGAR